MHAAVREMNAERKKLISGLEIPPENETTIEEWNQVMDINAKGVFFGCKRAIQQMLTQEVVGDARGICSGSAGAAYWLRECFGSRPIHLYPVLIGHPVENTLCEPR